MDNARLTAANVVGRWLRTEEFPDRLIGPKVQDRAFIVELVYGTVRRRRTLEWILSRCATREPDIRVLPFLLIGLYQILFMDEKPHAAVNETVQAAKIGGCQSASGFINGILRRVLREEKSLREVLSRQPLGIQESHPDVLLNRWCERFGQEAAAALCRWDNTIPAVTVRANRLKISDEELVASLSTAGIQATPASAPYARFLELAHGCRPTDLPGFKEGVCVVQDPSTALAVDLLGPTANQTVLDACAAPGGKTALIAEYMQDTGRVVALDLYDDRVERLANTVERLGLQSVSVVKGDARVPETIQKTCGSSAFDRILLDVPCSNTGVLRRRPDARWRFSEDRLAGLRRTQDALLSSASHCLAQGGRLVYSTCSLEPEEGEALVRSWLMTHEAFTLVEEQSLFPPESGTDGVYAAAIERR